jgi:hypothetical protein
MRTQIILAQVRTYITMFKVTGNEAYRKEAKRIWAAFKLGQYEQDKTVSMIFKGV